MKTIEEAAKEHADFVCKIGAYIKGVSSRDINESLIDTFKKGSMFAQRWIPVKEELPICDKHLTLFATKVSNPVIVKYDNGQVEIAILSDNKWYNSYGQRVYKPTHWRPIELK